MFEITPHEHDWRDGAEILGESVRGQGLWCAGCGSFKNYPPRVVGNTLQRNGDAVLFVFADQAAQIEGNTLEG